MQLRDPSPDNCASHRSRHRVRNGLLAALLLGAASTSFADVTLSYKETTSESAKGNTTQAFEINIKPPKLRMNEAGGMWMLYDGSIDTLFAVDPGRKSYTRINRERAAMMGGMVSAAEQQMQQMMKNMTPEQRAMMEQAMGRKLPSADSKPKTTYKKTGETRTVAGKKCEVGQMLTDGSVEIELCVADPKTVGVSKNEYDVMTGMFELMSELRKAAGSFFNREFPDPGEMNGVAIESRGDDTGHHVLADVSHKKLADTMFDLPTGYKEEAIPTAP